MRNPVRKHLHTFNKPLVHKDKKKSKQLDEKDKFIGTEITDVWFDDAPEIDEEFFKHAVFREGEK